MGIHVLGIKDMAGLMKPEAGRLLITALRDRFPDVAIHVHTHDTAGTGVATMIECAKAGADAVDCAIDSMSGMTSQPSMGAVANALKDSPYNTGLDLKSISRYNAYWEQVRQLYGPFECTVQTMKSGNADIYKHQIPGGQYTNLQFQAFALGLGHRFNELKDLYAEANDILGDFIKVTPSAKVVSDLALFMMLNNYDRKTIEENASELTFPISVVDFFDGKIGEPTYGYPEPLPNVLRGRKPKHDRRPGETLPSVDLVALKAELDAKHNQDLSDEDVMSATMFPHLFDEYAKFRQEFGPTDLLPTKPFLVGMKPGEVTEVELEKGKNLVIKYLGQIDSLTEKGERKLMFELNGQQRTIMVKDSEASKSVVSRPRADPSRKGSIGSPMAGEILEMMVKPGDTVKPNQTLFILYAMKMETAVTAPVGGVVKNVHVMLKERVDSGDLVVEIN
ncbi:hypothetical protein L596_014050 [Steinernema carpocapsae]|uniref:Pyruvate carboxylase n=1 Tax=Steinernema carpocapsae TaxID=34508 RepID=A0A4U5NAC7_STECR|nr:hypothetical protein L596_014050 [Steinernema carpocapsae]